jgi:uncharacterized cupin superfamily protein
VGAFSVVHLKQLEDSAAKWGYAPALEARFGREELGCKRTGLSYQRLAPNAVGPFAHRHGVDEEIYVVLSGSGRVKLDDDVIQVGAWDAVRVSPATVRAFAAGPDGLEILAFGTHTDNDAALAQLDWPA